VGIHIHAEDFEGAAGLWGDALDHFHSRCLPSPVWPEKPEDLPFPDPEGDAVDCNEVLKSLLQVARYDDVDDLSLPMVQWSRADTTFFRLTVTALVTRGVDLSGRCPIPGDPAE
jgi:hypothetical protein